MRSIDVMFETPRPQTIVKDKGGAVRLYATQRGRNIARAQLARSGYTHLVSFFDANRELPYGLSYGCRRVS